VGIATGIGASRRRLGVTLRQSCDGELKRAGLAETEAPPGLGTGRRWCFFAAVAVSGGRAEAITQRHALDKSCPAVVIAL